MFLSRITLNPRRRPAQRFLADPQAVHAAVLAGSATQPAPPPGEGGRPLWRLDRDDPRRPLLFAVTPDVFDFTHIAEQAGYPDLPETIVSAPYKGLLDRLEPGAVFAFRLTGNPVHSGRRNENSPTQRFGHVSVAQQLAWLTSRSESNGFEIVEATSGVPDVVIRDRRRVAFKRQGARVTIATATFDGQLRVREPDRLRTAMTRGIGHAKAYGCGLLTLAPINAPQA